MRLNRFIPVLLALALATGVAFAQQTTGKLTGTVTDPQGAVLPGVTVTASSPALIGGPQITQTGPDGEFNFLALAPGVYTVRLELEGFASQEQTVQVRLDRTAEIFPQLEIGQFGEEVTVVSDVPVVDTQQAGTGQVFSTEYLSRATVGSGGRSYQSVIGQSAGVAGGGGNPIVFGSTNSENAFYIDGLDTTDPVTATFGTNFNFDAIKEISFLTAGFEAEYGRATGGVVNLITKSGGNDFSGTVDVRYQTNDFAESGDFFDAELQETKFINPSATLGGPIARDKVWFFASYEDIDSELTPTNSPTTRDFEGQNYIGKITWQIAPSWRAVVKASSDPAEIANANAARTRPAETTRLQEQGGDIYSAELSAVLPNDMLWDIQAGINRQELNSFPMSGDLNTPGVQNDSTGFFSVNFGNAQFSERDRDEFRTSLTYFADNLGGSHEFKGGLSYDDLFFRTSNDLTGGAFYTDRNLAGVQRPRLLQVTPIQPPAEFTGDLLGGYVQDAWQIRPNFTLKLGVRYDEVGFNNDVGTEIAVLDKVQPRVGFAWDVANNAKTVVRGSWGRFMHPNALTLPSFARSSQTPSALYFACTRLGARSAADCSRLGILNFGGIGSDGSVIQDPLRRDPIGFVLAQPLASLPNQVDPNLTAMYADTYTLGVERQIANRTSVEVTYVNKETTDIFEDTCDGNFPTPDADGHCDFYISTNVPGLTREYEGILFRIESRATDWLHLIGSYTYSESQGNIEDTQNAGADFDVFPVHFVNTFGNLSDDRTHRVKLNGFVQLPLDFTVGVDGTWSSDFPFSVTDAGAFPYGEEFLEPRGSRRANSNYNLDLELRKGFTFGNVRAQLIGTVENALSTERPLTVCGDVVETGDPADLEFGGRFFAPACGTNTRVTPTRPFELGEALTFQQPRRYELGFRLEF